MFVVKVAHVGLPQSDGDAVDASFNARTQVVRLQSILRPKFPGPLSNCILISNYIATQRPRFHALSSCKLSINACFWLLVKRSFLAGEGPRGVASGALRNSGDLRLRVAMMEIRENRAC